MAEMGTRPSGKAGKKRGGLIIFLVGLVLGVLATVFAPRYLGDYLPGSIGGRDANVTGVVTRKLAEDTRLLLTVVTDSGAVLATFTDRKAEIDLLVEEGDSVTFSLPAYSPFVDDPRLGRVAKPVQGSGSERAESSSVGAETPGQAAEPADTGGVATPARQPADTDAVSPTPVVSDTAAARVRQVDHPGDRLESRVPRVRLQTETREYGRAWVSGLLCSTC